MLSDPRLTLSGGDDYNGIYVGTTLVILARVHGRMYDECEHAEIFDAMVAVDLGGDCWGEHRRRAGSHCDLAGGDTCGTGQIGFAWRLAGCGGFLGWFGLFYSRSLGEFWAYTGNREDLVLLTQTDGGKIVISPHPPDTFVKAVQETDGSRRVR